MSAITLDIGANTRRAERDIQKLVNKAYNINLTTKGDQPLGRITGKVNEFEKSLAASNARVIAFGASAGIIFGVQSAFVSLAKSVVDVQKSLQDINVILNVSTTQLNKFGADLFNIAKNTGQSFQEVANAATEFSRQGLGVEETLKRTNEALILSRLSGLDTVKSVEALTAAVNSFASQAVTATQIVNKFATVDAAFAVSSADLADALARVGSSAAQSGVSLDELIAIVTSAQQTTARGGAVIGNSLKTIFTRLQREKVVNLLESLGVTTTGAGGELKSTIDLLEDLAQVYDNLGTQQQAYVAEQVGGVFQINILKAALADLGKEYSIYNNALKISATATDQAIKRNEELNKTFAAQLNALQQNITQFGGNVGERLLTPLFNRTVGNLNDLLGGINESDANGFGATLGKGILDGLGQVIAGPGLALIGGLLIKLFKDFSVFASGSLKDLLGLNSASKQQAELQKSINQIISKNPDLYALMQKGASGLNQASQILLQNLKSQTLELQTQQKLSAVIAKQFYGAGVRISEGVPVAPSVRTGKIGKAAGYIPNFAEEFQAKELGATSSVKAVRGVGKIGGKSFEANNQEFQFKNFAGTGETAVIPKYGDGIKEAAKMIARGESGSVLDRSDRNRAVGFIPKASTKKDKKEKGLPGLPIQSVRGESAKGLSTLYDQRNDFDKYIRPRIQRTPLEQTYEKYRFQAEGIVKKLRQRAEKSNNPELEIENLFKKQLFRNVPITDYTDKIIPSTLLNPSSDSSNANNVQGALGEIDNAKKFVGATKLADIQGSDFLVKETGGSYLVESKVRKKNTPDSVLIAKALRYEAIKRGSYKDGKGQSIKLKDIILSYAERESARKRRGFASGFIPNFAQTTVQSNKVVELGDTTTNPLFRGKVSSLIYPQISENKSKAQGETTYLGKKYRGLVSIAGINKKALKGELPDLEKNLDQLLLREANEFGRAIGGTEFLQSASELPNIGAAKGAVGVSFEGGLLTLLQRDVQKSAQNARIDFTQDRINTKFKSLFHGAPGTYEAKYSPSLTGEVLQKMLRGAGVGQVAQPKSGAGAVASLKQREAVLASINKDVAEGKITQPRRGNALEAEVRKRLPLMFPGAVKGAAAGYIPNFAAPKLIEAINRRITNPNISTKLSEGSGLSNDAYIRAATKLGVNTSGLDAFLKQPGFPLKGRAKIQALSRALGEGWLGRSFNVDALKIGDWKYLQKQFEENGLTKNDFDQVTKFARSSRGERALKMGFKSQATKMREMEFLSRPGAAAGYIPNFAAIQDAVARERAAGIPSSQIYLAQENALKSANPMGLGVFNKQDEPTRGSRKDAMRQKGFASGYIPNFAIGANDEEPANLAASVAAIGTQLGSLALVLSLNKDSLNSSLEELIGKQKIASGATVADAKLRQRVIKEEIAASEGNVQKIKKLQGEYNKLSTQIGKTRNRGDVTTATTGQKITAGISANALGITFIAPIIAETVANAIGQGSKEARAQSAGISGLGQAASLAGTGFLIGGPVGAAVGGAIGVVTTLTGVIREASTDIPELTVAANKSSQALTKLNDTTNTISTGFSNLLQLRETGKTREAATVEAGLINEIQKTFKDNANLAVQAISAVKSGDFEMLSKALGENTKAVLEKNIQDQRNLSVGAFREENAAIGRSNFISGRANYGLSKEEAKQFGATFEKNILGSSKLESGEIQGQTLQDLNKEINNIVGNQQASPEVLSNLFSKIGIDFEKTGIQGNEKIRLALALLRSRINERAEREKAASDDSEENNARLRAINQALNKAYSQYQQLAKNAAASAKFEFDLANQRRELSVEFGKTVLEGRSQLAETLGVSSAGQRGITNQQRALEIDENFDKTVNDSLGEVNSTFADLKSQLIESRISEIQKGTDIEAKTALEKAETRTEQIKTVAPEFEFFGKNIKDAIATLDKSIQESVKTGSLASLTAFEQAISAGIKTEDPEVKKQLEAVKESAKKTAELALKAEQTRKAQLAILAQQNINQIAQEFAKATVAAFGGFEKEFLGKDIGDKSLATEISDVGIQRQNFVDALNRRQSEGSGPITEIERQELGRLSGNVYSAIENIVGRPLGLSENTTLREQEIAGRATQIESGFKQIRSELGGAPEISQLINEAEKKLAEQVGPEFGQRYQEIQTQFAGDETGMRAALDQLFKEVVLETAKVQSNELRKTGDISGQFEKAAISVLPEEQKKALEQAGFTANKIINDPTKILQVQLVKTDETNSILGQIRDEIQQALFTPNANAANAAFNFGSGPGQVPLPTFNTTVSPTVNINMNGGMGDTQVNAEGMSTETAKVLEENKDRILAAGGLVDKVASLENTVYSQFPDRRPPPRISREERGG